MSIGRLRECWKNVIFLAATTALVSAYRTANAEVYTRTFCRDFEPSISYLNVALPAALVNPGEDRFATLRHDPNTSEITKLNLPPAPLFSQAGIRYALIVNFIQQMAIGALVEEIPLFQTLRVMKLADSVEYAMGFGLKGTRLREPGDQPTGFEAFTVEYVESDDAWIQSDSSKTVFVTRGVVKNIVTSSIEKSFGSIDNYEKFVEEIVGIGAVPGYAKDLRGVVQYRGDYIDPTVFPLGEVLSNSSIDDSNYLYPLARLSEMLVGKFLFIGAHEIGHENLNHRALKDVTCDVFRRIEREADEFAAKVLASFNFSMSPHEFQRARLTDFDPFFLEYEAAGFSNEDLATACKYDFSETRRKNVVAAYERAIDELRAITFGGPDYANANPTHILCRNGRREPTVILKR